LGSYTKALLVSQDRRHLYVTPCVLFSGFRNSEDDFRYRLENNIACTFTKIE
jgi:hypothetical protein